MLFVLLAVLEQFLNHIRHHNLFSNSDAVLLAVSGGIDSMVMLELFRQTEIKLAVAHCNFRLRANDADDDEKFVRKHCEKIGVTCFVQQFETAIYAANKKISIQNAARELRYNWFASLSAQHSFSKVATAHHFGDSMETIIMHITQGSATEGLVGIPVKNANVIRPLLFATRDAIVRYAQGKNISWREDGSNSTDDYQRNFVRHHIIPRLKDLNPSLEGTWQQGVEKLQDDLALINKVVADWKRVYVNDCDDRTTIAKKGFNDSSFSATLFWRAVRSFGFNYDQVKEVIKAVHGQPGKKFLSDKFEMIIDRNELIITQTHKEWQAVAVLSHGQSFSLGPWKMSLMETDVADPGTNGMEVTLDAEAVHFPLTWRRWRNGDAFHPLGMKGRKKISDFLIDNKVSVADKNDVTVLESEGKIVYVVGWRIDDYCKLTTLTKKMLHVKVTRS